MKNKFDRIYFSKNNEKENSNSHNGLLDSWLAWIKRETDIKPSISLDFLDSISFSSVSQYQWTIDNEACFWACLQFNSFRRNDYLNNYFLSLEFFRRHHLNYSPERLSLFPKELSYILVRDDLSDGFRNSELGNDQLYRGFIKETPSLVKNDLKSLNSRERHHFYLLEERTILIPNNLEIPTAKKIPDLFSAYSDLKIDWVSWNRSSSLPDKNYTFSKRLYWFLNQIIFPQSIETFFTLSLSFDNSHLPTSLDRCIELVENFINLLKYERFYVVIEGDFSNPEIERPNVHIAFTRKELPFKHQCEPCCLTCKGFYLRLWNKGSIYIDKIESEEKRIKVLEYISKLTKKRRNVNSTNKVWIKDYWQRVCFSSEFLILYVKELDKLLLNSNKNTASRKYSNRKEVNARSYSKNRENILSKARAKHSLNKEEINRKRRERYKGRKTKNK